MDADFADFLGSLREGGLVEPVGIEPTTFALQTRRSPS